MTFNEKIIINVTDVINIYLGGTIEINWGTIAILVKYRGTIDNIPIKISRKWWKLLRVCFVWEKGWILEKVVNNWNP